MANPVIRDQVWYGPEHHVMFRGNFESWITIASGGCALNPSARGNSDSGTTYDIRLIVGPYCQDVVNVSPSVFITAWYAGNADEDDREEWRVGLITWQAVPFANGLRTELAFEVKCAGEHSAVWEMGYHVAIESSQEVWYPAGDFAGLLTP